MTEFTNINNNQQNGAKPKRPVNPNLQHMQQGTHLTKIRKRAFKRFFVLHEDCLTFGYTDSKKSLSCFSDDSVNPVPVSDIKEIRDGVSTDNLRKRLPKLQSKGEEPLEDRCFSVVVGDRSDIIDLVAPTAEEKRKWVRGLQVLMKKMGEADLQQQQNIWVRELFKMADKNGDNCLNLKEIVGLMKHLNIEVDLETAKEVFQKADTNKTPNKKNEDCLDTEEFVKFYKMMTKREEIDDLFLKYDYDASYLDAEELQDFFKHEQKQNLTVDECLALIDKYEACPSVKVKRVMSIDAFHAMFSGPEMEIFNPQFGKIYQDMTRPMCDYFIDSSHNTYLVEDQLVGPSKVEAYIRALKRGCRCVELDCWDGAHGTPVIYHGHTLTSKIAFKDAIQAINTYAFEASEYPVILSIENHCSVEQQRIMAYDMLTIFGDKLLKKELGAEVCVLPSPEQLKHKIIVKGKHSKSSISGDVKAKKIPETHDDDDVSDEDEAAEMEGIDNEEVKKEMEKGKKEQKHKLAKELSDIVIICQSASFKGFEHAQKNCTFKHISSFGERKSKDLIESSPMKWIDHNKRQLSRIYPGGLRTDSSNYEPMPMWLCGNQVVALNYQTPDEDMHVYKGFFLDNGSCGYVLKPHFLTNPGPTEFNPQGPFPSDRKKQLTIKIVSGYQLPKKKGDKTRSILDPYIKVDVKSVKSEGGERQSKHINNNGFHPVWNENFNFTLSVPELAVVRFRVMDYQSHSSNVLVAQYCIPVKCMQQGYRTIHLKSKYGEKIWGAQIFVHINIQDASTQL